MEGYEIIITNALIRAAKGTCFFSVQKKYHSVCFWDDVADEIRDKNINEKEIDLFFRSAANNLYELISDRQQIMLPPINELQDATPDLKKIVSDFRRVFPFDRRSYQIPYFDDRIVIFYSRLGMNIVPDNTQQPTQEVKNYLSIIDELGIKDNISKFYTDLCSKQEAKQLFSIQFPYQNIYSLSGFSKLLSESQFEDERKVEKELNVYCDWFLKGYNEFEAAKMYDNDIFELVVNFDYEYKPFFIVDDKIVISPIHDYGKKVGKCYAAWFYLLNHQSAFEPLFQQLYTQPQTKELPKELQTDEAKALFQKAIVAGFVEENGNFYNWKGETKQLLAYFAERLSKALNLSPKLDKEGNITTNWKVFEIAFNTTQLKSAKNDWMKVNTLFTPNGYEKIDLIFV